MTLAMVLATAYLLGSIPTSYIIVQLVTGRDIRALGNGNPGAMNVWDNVGLWSALLVAIGDVGKGMAAVGFAYWMGLDDGSAIIAALIAVAGHDFSIFLRFDGGNGTAAAVGSLLALVPAAAVPASVIAVVLYLVVRSKRFAGLTAMLMLPLLAYYSDYSSLKVLAIFLILGVVAVKIIRFEGFTPARTRPPR